MRQQFTGFGGPNHSFQDETSDVRVFEDAHKETDVDSERNSLHHTLGSGPTQAAPGNHGHIGMVRVYSTTANLPVGWLRLNGAVINQADYPRFFSSAGITTATYTLPNYSGLIVRVA